MAIVKKKGKNGKSVIINTTTGKFASEAAYKKAKSSPIAKFKARKGKPSEATCSSYGAELKVKRTSSAGRGLRKCR